MLHTEDSVLKKYTYHSCPDASGEENRVAVFCRGTSEPITQKELSELLIELNKLGDKIAQHNEVAEAARKGRYS